MIGLPYGPRKDWDLVSPFFCLNCHNKANSVWEQVFYEGEVVLFKLIYTFEDEKIFKDRFNNAAANGENVEWTVYKYKSGKRSGKPVTITGLWYWTTDSVIGDEGRTYPTKKRGPDFSQENGCWAAGSPYVNGGDDSSTPGESEFIEWGQCQGAFAACNQLYMDGLKYTVNNPHTKLSVLE
jgi:hypothetical protein